MTEPDTPVRVTVVPRPAVTTKTDTLAPQSTKLPDDPDARRAAIKATIEQLDLSDPAHATEEGKPDATVLSDLLGRKISARERDEVWAEMESDPNQSRARK
jgi:hypothetical protein